MVDSSAPFAALPDPRVKVGAVYVGGINNGGRDWTPIYAAGLRQSGAQIFPIYVGQNVCGNCDSSRLTADQGAKDGADAVRCAKLFGCQSGPLCLDVEYDTQFKAGVQGYAGAWAEVVSAAGYLPVMYAPPLFAQEHTPAVPTGLWLTHWLYTTYIPFIPISTSSVRATLRGYGVTWPVAVGQQYADRYLDTYDLSVLEDSIMTGSGAADVITVNGYIIGHGFLDLWRSLGARAIPIFGLPLGEEEAGDKWGLAGYTVQWFERARFEYNKATGAITLGLVGEEAMAYLRGDPLGAVPGGGTK